MGKNTRIFTVGHSTRTTKEFLALLQSQKLKLVVDVRTIPKSRHNPQFGQARLRSNLKRHNIEYRWMKGLGGLRRPRKDSTNTAWRNSGFRGFADYMQTPEFEDELERLIRTAKRKRLVIMCSEAVPWRCHRSLIADALVARGVPVQHIMNAKTARDHKITSFAKIRRNKIKYPSAVYV